MDQENKSVSHATNKSAAKFHLKWWGWLIIIVVIMIASLVIVKFADRYPSGSDKLNIPDTAEEIQIKQYISSLRGDIVRYHSSKMTYEGWKPDQRTVDEIKKMGSELKTQALSKDTYIIYAKMPNSKTIFCMDHNSFAGEVVKLSNQAKICN